MSLPIAMIGSKLVSRKPPGRFKEELGLYENRDMPKPPPRFKRIRERKARCVLATGSQCLASGVGTRARRSRIDGNIFASVRFKG